MRSGSTRGRPGGWSRFKQSPPSSSVGATLWASCHLKVFSGEQRKTSTFLIGRAPPHRSHQPPHRLQKHANITEDWQTLHSDIVSSHRIHGGAKGVTLFTEISISAVYSSACAWFCIRNPPTTTIAAHVLSHSITISRPSADAPCASRPALNTGAAETGSRAAREALHRLTS